MTRAALLVTLGVGVVSLPDASSLLPFALVVVAAPWISVRASRFQRELRP